MLEFIKPVTLAMRLFGNIFGGEVLVTRPVVDMSAGIDGVDFERIGEVRLKGFSEPTELFVAAHRG